MSRPEAYARLTPYGRWSWLLEVVSPPPIDNGWIETSVTSTVFGSRARADRVAARRVLRERRRVERIVRDTHEVRP